MSNETVTRGAVMYIAPTLTKRFSSVGVHGYYYNTEVPKKGHGCKKGYPADFGYNVEKDPAFPAVTVERYIERVFFEKESPTNIEPNSNAVLLILEEVIAHIKNNELVTFSLTLYVLKSIVKQWMKAEAINAKGGDRFSDSGDELISAGHLEFAKQFAELKKQLQTFGCVLQLKPATIDKKPDFGEGLALVLSEMPYSDYHIDYDTWHRFKEDYDIEVYWKYTYNNHRLLGAGRWYFHLDESAVKTEEGEWIYLMSKRLDEEEEKQVGKMIPNTGLSVVMCKEPEPLLEIVRRKQMELTPNSSFIFRASTVDIFSNSNAYHILTNPDVFIKRANRMNCNLELPGKKVITEECNPPLLSFRILQEYENLYRIYENYKKNSPELSITDITDKFYDLVTDKKGEVKYCFKKELPVGIKKLMIPVIYDSAIGKKELLLTFNIDLPDRNALSGIADEKPKVSVVVWKQDLFGHRFAVVIETDSVKGIWAGVYSNLIWNNS